MSARRVVSNPGFFAMVKSKPETWPVIGAVGVAVSYMTFRSYTALVDVSIRWNPAHRSDGLHYMKKEPAVQQLLERPTQTE